MIVSRPRSTLIVTTILSPEKTAPQIAASSKDYIKIHEPISFTMSRNMIVNMSFNCPEIQILGPVQESTIERLNEVLPDSTTSTRSIRSNQPKFEYLSNPDHWRIKLDNQFCDLEGVSRLIVLLLDALEEEGGWTLISSQASSSSHGGALQQDFVSNYKLFFSKYQDDE
ncbi:paraflagellar rod component, putative [Leishmania donovani]|nr:paraflagellar rod component, putative [Leishmania donovani]VDZ47867.1 paraflagellar_rod_component_putative/GeneDB:LmjF.33.0610 [Leishmania donovani]